VTRVGAELLRGLFALSPAGPDGDGESEVLLAPLQGPDLTAFQV